ncbi:hypothetical protein SAMN04488061_2886 [Filomicrobium insigne]|uniref:Carboxypeptidase regulatory-like domain-containing protein n=1 Tax=Filomicrobium insigne TaxID=418854 RepID=A0A1H0SGH9_9HYPH|nr:hypothetical protein [Filomicrobium insigne]SDP40790.1 hypothetical protein SAMN04488061_2886 [Filomicrobium insigne]
MAEAIWQATIVDDAGNVQDGATVSVHRMEAGFPLALIHSDRAGTEVKGNPFSVGSDGFAAFHAPGGVYRITATKGAFSKTWDYVAIGRGSEIDPGSSALLDTASDTEVNEKAPDRVMTSDVLFSPLVPATVTSSATPGIDLALGRKFRLTFDESFVLQLPTHCAVGDEFVVHFTEGSGSGVTAGFAAGYVGSDEELPTINTGAGDRTRVHCEVTAVSGTTATEVLVVAAGGLWGAP